MKVGTFQVQEPVPELRDPHMISILHPWIDAGSAGTIALRRLERRLHARDLAKLEDPGRYFDFTRYRPTSQWEEGQRRLTVPNTIVNYARAEGYPDLLFCHLLEPHAMAEEYAESLVALLRHFSVKRHFRIGAMLDAVPHTRPLRLTGTMDDRSRSRLRRLVAQPRSTYQGPTSIVMGLLAPEMEALNIESVSLMLHLPQYLSLEEDYSGAARLLEAVGVMYGLPLNFPEAAMGRRQYRQISAELAEEDNAEVRELVGKLERDYDDRAAEAAGDQPDSADAGDAPPLAPDVERFLRDLNTSLDAD